MSNADLKPCPFCGADEGLLKTIVVDNEICFVKCCVCGGASGRASSQREATEVWNRRNNDEKTNSA